MIDRVEDLSGSLAYLPDHGPVQGCSDEVRAMIRGVDVLLHDAQFLESERSTADLFGHATVDEAIRLATEAKVGTLVLFHHAPARTDAQLDALPASWRPRRRWSSPRRGRALTFRADLCNAE